jgi:hypothetical protein
MLEAALKAEVAPRQLSFAHALQTVAASWLVVLALPSESQAVLIDTLIESLRRPFVGRRPHRVEPRAVKRRPKPHDLLMKPRDEARAELLGSRA